MADKIQLRRDTAANWTSANPTLASGEIGLETDTDQFKVGNGVAAWSALSYGGIQGPQGIQGETGPTGPQGPQGIQGETGPTGADGKTVLSGTGAPASGLGVDGDFYIDTAASDIYGPKTSGVWGTGTSLIGPQGIQGETGPQGPQGVPGEVTADGVFTLTNKTLVEPIITGTIVEDVYAVTGTTPALDPANGSIQTWTLTGNSTPTDSLAAGEAITLMVDDGTAYTITWPTTTWVNNAGAAPTLATTGYTVIALWKVSTTLYGALVGDGT